MDEHAPGERTVRYLLDKGRLEEIPAVDLAEAAGSALARSTRRLATARAGMAVGDVEGAFAAAYDAYRMAAEALLLRQGLRSTGGDGSHTTVEDAVAARFTAEIPAFAKPTFERFRRTRHLAQYFDPVAPPLEEADARWALQTSEKAVSGAGQVLASKQLKRFGAPEEI